MVASRPSSSPVAASKLVLVQTLANVAVFQKDFAEAVRLSAEALAILERDGHSASREAAMIRNGYAQALWLVDRSDDALREIDHTLVDWQRVAPEGKARRVMMLVLKVQILQELKRPDDARKVANEAIAVGANPGDLAPAPKEILRKVSGRNDVFLEVAATKASK